MLVSIDTLRADMLGCYGYERPTSPTLDGLAGEGALFEDVVATSPWTLPSHGSLLTGLYPSRHGLRSPWRTMPAEIGTLAEALAGAGFETGAIVNSFYLGKRFGLDRGFETLTQLERPPASTRPSAVSDLAIRWLDRRDPARRFFLFLHYYDVHSDYAAQPRHRRAFERPYAGAARGTTEQLTAFRRGEVALSAEDGEHLRDRYAAEIHQVDASFGRLWSALDERGLLGETLVVVTSDHGEEFLEHGGVMHGATHYQEVLRVPWILAGPGVPPRVRVPEPVSLVDVMPTLLSLLGVPGATDLDGRDVSPLLRGEDAPSLVGRRLFAETGFGAEWNEGLASVREGSFKLVAGTRSGRRALFDLAADPEERGDAADRHPEVSERLRAALEARAGVEGPDAEAVDLSPDERERLRALGYVP